MKLKDFIHKLDRIMNKNPDVDWDKVEVCIVRSYAHNDTYYNTYGVSVYSTYTPTGSIVNRVIIESKFKEKKDICYSVAKLSEELKEISKYLKEDYNKVSVFVGNIALSKASKRYYGISTWDFPVKYLLDENKVTVEIGAPNCNI